MPSSNFCHFPTTRLRGSISPLLRPETPPFNNSPRHQYPHQQSPKPQQKHRYYNGHLRNEDSTSATSAYYSSSPYLSYRTAIGGDYSNCTADCAAATTALTAAAAPISRTVGFSNGVLSNGGPYYWAAAAASATSRAARGAAGRLGSSGSGGGGGMGSGFCHELYAEMTNNPITNSAGNVIIPLILIRRREPTKWAAAIDAAFAIGLLVFHGLTLMVQELPEGEDVGVPTPGIKSKIPAVAEKKKSGMLFPDIPMTPSGLFITGYMEVIAWIGILSVNFFQLCVAMSLFNSCAENADALKAFEASLAWLKTNVFLMIILSIKLCVLYFMYAMEMKAYITMIFTGLEFVMHIVGLFVVMKFYEEIKRNYPMTSQIYKRAHEETSEGEKRKNVADAVWC